MSDLTNFDSIQEELLDEIEEDETEGEELTDDPPYEYIDDVSSGGSSDELSEDAIEFSEWTEALDIAVSVCRQSKVLGSDIQKMIIEAACHAIAPSAVMLSISALFAQPAGAFYWNEPGVIDCHPQRGLPSPGCPVESDVLDPVYGPPKPLPKPLPVPSPTVPTLPFPHPSTI